MTINSVNILFSWYDEDEKLLKELKKRADDGNQECLADFIGIQTELSTDKTKLRRILQPLKNYLIRAILAQVSFWAFSIMKVSARIQR